MNKTVVVKCGDSGLDGWVKQMGELLPEHTVKRWDDEYAADDVTHVVGGAQMPNGLTAFLMCRRCILLALVLITYLT